MAEEKIEHSMPDRTNWNAAVKSDPGTTDTTDPQEHMRGPLSSFMHKIEETAEKNDKKDIDKKKSEGKIP